MTRRGLLIASGALVAAMLVVAVVVGSSLPTDMRLPVHWGFDGKADRLSDKWSALLLPALLTAGVSALFYYLPSFEPRRESLQRSQGLYRAAWAGVLVVFSATQLAVVSAALNWNIPVERTVIGAVALMLVLIGDQLGKSRATYLIGIRTPWTLASDEVWIKTHRLGGKLMVAAGLAIGLAALLARSPELLMATVLVSLSIAIVIPVVYSFLLWREEQRA